MRYEHVPFHTGLLGNACQAGTYGGSLAGAKVVCERFRDNSSRNRPPSMVRLRRTIGRVTGNTEVMMQVSTRIPLSLQGVTLSRASLMWDVYWRVTSNPDVTRLGKGCRQYTNELRSAQRPLALPYNQKRPLNTKQ